MNTIRNGLIKLPAAVFLWVVLLASAEAGYLGIKVETVPENIRSALSADLPENGAVIVTGLATNSPAALSGIQVQDILLSYAEKPIVSPQSFIDAVGADKAASVVMIKLLRQGEIKVLPVTLGDQLTARHFPPLGKKIGEMQLHSGLQNQTVNVSPSVAKSPRDAAAGANLRARPLNSNNGTNGARPQGSLPKDFAGLAIRRMGDDIYNASIGVPGWDGSVQRRSFVGTREQILQQIMMDRTLPPEARQQLLFAVKPRKQSSGWDNMPFMDGDSSLSPRRFFDFFGF